MIGTNLILLVFTAVVFALTAWNVRRTQHNLDKLQKLVDENKLLVAQINDFYEKCRLHDLS